MEATEAKDEICCQNLMSHLFTDALHGSHGSEWCSAAPLCGSHGSDIVIHQQNQTTMSFRYILFVGELVFVLYARGSAEPLHGSHGSDTVVTVVKPGHDVFLPPPTRKPRKR